MANPLETARNGARFITPTLFQPMARELLRLAELEPDDHLLDLACGSAVVARLAEQTLCTPGSAVGVDPNPAALQLASPVALSFQAEFPSPTAFVERFVKSTSLAPLLCDPSELGAVCQAMEEGLRPYTTAGLLRIPLKAYCVRGVKAPR